MIESEKLIELPCGHKIPEAWLLSKAASLHGKRAKTGGKREGAGRPKCSCGHCPACLRRAK